jgi:hypothetical protein
VLLPITTDVLVGEAERLGGDGHRYSSRQLYYAACRAVERPAVSVTRGFVGLGALLIVLGGAMLWVKTIPLSAILAVIGVALLLAAPLNARVERNRELQRALDSRTLATSYPSFLAGPRRSAPWRHLHQPPEPAPTPPPPRATPSLPLPPRSRLSSPPGPSSSATAPRPRSCSPPTPAGSATAPGSSPWPR